MLNDKDIQEPLPQKTGNTALVALAMGEVKIIDCD